MKGPCVVTGSSGNQWAVCVLSALFASFIQSVVRITGSSELFIKEIHSKDGMDLFVRLHFLVVVVVVEWIVLVLPLYSHNCEAHIGRVSATERNVIQRRSVKEEALGALGRYVKKADQKPGRCL